MTGLGSYISSSFSSKLRETLDIDMIILSVDLLIVPILQMKYLRSEDHLE